MLQSVMHVTRQRIENSLQKRTGAAQRSSLVSARFAWLYGCMPRTLRTRGKQCSIKTLLPYIYIGMQYVYSQHCSATSAIYFNQEYMRFTKFMLW